jgi:transcriptional regulator with XRE-family HTH domain
VGRFGPSAERLGQLLRRLRLATGLSQPKFAEQLGWAQSKVSRAETGAQRLTMPEVDAWCRKAGAGDDQREAALTLAEAMLVGASPEELTKDGESHLQRDIAEEEARSDLICAYHPVVVPGLLQTPNYLRRVFSARPSGPPEDLADRMLGRMERQRILYSDKRLRFIVPETVLRWPFGPIDEQLEQIDRIRVLTTRPNVRLGIIPIRPPAAWRSNGFVIFDERTDDHLPFVQVEVLGKLIFFDEPRRVEEYRQAFAQLNDAAVFDDEARALLDRISQDLRPGD